MTATAHAIIGGAIAASIQNPVLGITLSAISHPLLDMIPHWDEGLGWRKKTKIRLFTEASIDLLAGFGLAFLLFGPFTNPWYLFFCVAVSVGWDVLEAPYLLWGWKPFYPFYKMQSKIQGRAQLPWGVLTQVAAIYVVIFLLKAFTTA